MNKDNYTIKIRFEAVGNGKTEITYDVRLADVFREEHDFEIDGESNFGEVLTYTYEVIDVEENTKECEEYYANKIDANEAKKLANLTFETQYPIVAMVAKNKEIVLVDNDELAQEKESEKTL